MAVAQKIILVSFCFTLWACGEKNIDDYLASAQKNIAEQHYKAAVIELKNAIKQQPEHAKARFLLGKAYLQLKQYDSAEKELNRALEYKYPANEVVPLLSRAYQNTRADNALIKLSHKQKGLTTAQATEIAFQKIEAFVRLEQREKAKKLIDEVKNYQTNSPYKALILVYSLLLENKIDAALVQLDQIVKHYPSQADALKLKANILLNQGKKEQAIRVYRQYVKENADDLEAAFIFAHLLANAGYPQEAEPIVDKLLKVNADNPLLNQLKGLARFHAKDNKNALIYTEKAIQKNPDDNALRVVAGVSAFLINNYEKAHQHLSFVAEQLPPSHPALRLLAASQLKLGLTLDASQTLAKFDQLSANDASLFSSIGLALVRQGEINKAKQILARSKQLKTAEKDSENLARMGLLKLSLNDVSGIVNLESALAQITQDNKSEALQAPIKQTLATAYLSTGQLDKALALAKRWKQENPKDGYAYLLSGLVYLEQKDKARAKAEFEQLIALEPNNSKAKMALLTVSDYNNAQAKSALKAILASDPSYVPAFEQLYALAKKENNSQSVKQLITQIKSAITGNKDNIALQLLLAQIYLAEQQPSLAINLLETLKAQQDSPAPFWQLLGKAYVQNKSYAKAKTLYQEWLAKQANNKMAVFGSIVYLDSEGDYKKALALAEKYLQEQNNDVQIALLRVHLLIMNNDFAGAKQAYEKLPQAVKNHPFARGLLGQLQLHDKNYIAALDNLKIAYQAIPNSRHTRLIAASYYLLGKKAQGRAFLAQHLKQHPDDQAVLMQLANEQLIDDTEKAIANYQTAIKLNDRNGVAHNNLAYLYMQQGKLELALTHAKKALALLADDENVLDTLGQIYRQKQAYQTALNYLTKAVANPEVSEEIYLNYIELLLLTDQLELAKRKIAQRTFNNASYRAKLAKLTKAYGISESP